ncbi:MAG TPA: ATP-binding protein [Gemmatimonadaceae bacterium]|nr:ATP-binding protein [Gemmatimonadaceae bacterium]
MAGPQANPGAPTADTLAPRSRVASYAAAALFVALATAGTYLLQPLLAGRLVGVLFFAAVGAAALYGGRGPGFLAAGLGVVLLDYLFIPPAYSLNLTDVPDLLALALFGGVAVWLSAVGASLQERRRGAEAERDRASALAEELQAQAVELEQQTEEARALAEELEESASAARASEARATAVVESALDCIIMMDHEGRVIEFNPAAERTFGYPRAQAIGRPLAELIVPPSLREAHRRGLQRYLATGEGPVMGRRIEITGMRADGTEFPVELAITQIALPGPPVFTGYLRDLSERKRAEEALALLAEGSRVLAASLDVEATLAAVARLAIAGLADGCLVTVVEKGEQGAPFRHAPVASRDPEKAALVEEINRRFPLPADAPSGYPSVIRTGRPEVVDPRAFDESVLPGIAQSEEHLRLLRRLEMYSAMVVPLTARGQTLGAITLVRHGPGRRALFDAADLALAEELGRRAALAVDNARAYEAAKAARDEAEAASRAKSEFMAVMSHELRTPLNAIIGYTALLAEGVGGPLTEAQQNHLARVRASAQHLLELIDQVLSLSRLDAGREEVRLAPVDAGAVARDSAALIEPSAVEKGLRFEVDVPAGACVVRSDATKIRQALLNLLSNAVKYTEHGTVALEMRAEPGRIVYRVRDTGIGIEPEQQDRIFDSFYQVDQGPTRRAGGTGLGLSVTRRLARLLGGDVAVESEVGRGSAFTVWLPRADRVAPGG